MSPEAITRRNLPHWYMPGAMHFVTFRLAGSLPRETIEDLEQRKKLLLQNMTRDAASADQRYRIHKQLFAAYDHYLDNHRDIDWLNDARIASLIRGSLYHLHGEQYLLLAYTIMPNHVHALFQPLAFDG